MKIKLDGFPAGTVVKSCAGRDRKRVFIVIGTEESRGDVRLVVTDGSLHPVSKPKLKNLRHVRVIGSLTDAEMEELKSLDDKKVERILVRYDEYRAIGCNGKNI